MSSNLLLIELATAGLAALLDISSALRSPSYDIDRGGKTPNPMRIELSHNNSGSSFLAFIVCHSSRNILVALLEAAFFPFLVIASLKPYESTNEMIAEDLSSSIFSFISIKEVILFEVTSINFCVRETCRVWSVKIGGVHPRYVFQCIPTVLISLPISSCSKFTVLWQGEHTSFDVIIAGFLFASSSTTIGRSCISACSALLLIKSDD